MAIWLIRAGSHGEYEHKFISENRVYVTWDGLNVNVANGGRGFSGRETALETILGTDDRRALRFPGVPGLY